MIRELPRRITRTHPRWGWRKAHRLLRTTGTRSTTSESAATGHDKVIAEPDGDQGTAGCDSCRFSEVAAAFIEPGSRWQNGYCDSLNGTATPPTSSTDV